VAKAPEVRLESSPKKKPLVLTVVDDEYKKPAETSNKAVEYGDGLASTKIKQLKLASSSASSSTRNKEIVVSPRK